MPKIIDVINHLAGNDASYPQEVTGRTPDLTVSQLDKGNSQSAALPDQKINWSQEAADKLPAQPETALSLLYDIREQLMLLQEDQTHPYEDFFRVRTVVIPGGGGYARIEGTREFSYIYIPGTNGIISVFLGDGTSQYLASKAVDSRLMARVPRTDVINLYGFDNVASPGTAYQVFVWLSTRPITVETYDDTSKHGVVP